MDQITCCCFDLETSSLDADFGVLLCAVVKPAGGPYKTFRADRLNPSWARRRSDDSAILRAVAAELERYDVWCAHNGAWFDVPFLRARLLRWGLPALPTRKLVDPVQLARRKLRLSGNSLRTVARHLGAAAKRELEPTVWQRAALDGDRAEMDQRALGRSYLSPMQYK
jgi:uncharacterized protein YprB with RNaseH-like and TPR domain